MNLPSSALLDRKHGSTEARKHESTCLYSTTQKDANAYKLTPDTKHPKITYVLTLKRIREHFDTNLYMIKADSFLSWNILSRTQIRCRILWINSNTSFFLVICLCHYWLADRHVFQKVTKRLLFEKLTVRFNFLIKFSFMVKCIALGLSLQFFKSTVDPDMIVFGVLNSFSIRLMHQPASTLIVTFNENLETEGVSAVRRLRSLE